VSEKRSTYQEPIEEEVGWTSCGQRVRLGGKVPSSADVGTSNWMSVADAIE
jgi:hypothetical protein